MRRIILVGVLLLLAACAAAPSRYGNYAPSAAGAVGIMSNDSIRQLAELYPPALNRFNLLQPTNDAFGAALVAGLRARGYAVAEYVPPVPNKQSPAPKGATLGYTLTQAAGSNLVYLTLYVGPQVLSRVYVADADNSAYAAGAWAHKE